MRNGIKLSIALCAVALVLVYFSNEQQKNAPSETTVASNPTDKTKSNKKGSTSNSTLTSLEIEIYTPKKLEDGSEQECIECSSEDDSFIQEDDTNSSLSSPVISTNNIQLDPPVEKVSVDDQHLLIDELFMNESVKAEWSTATESELNNVFRDNNNNAVLSESGLDYSDSECRSTVCSVNFVPHQGIDGMTRMDRMRQLLSLTSFFEQEQSLSEARMFTEYTEDGRLVVKLLFND